MSTLAAETRPQSTPGHLFVLAGAAAILVLSLLLPADGVEQGVHLPGVGFALPSTCVWSRLTHTGCPACGLTRGFILAAHGEWPRAAAMHPLAIPLLVLCVLQLPLRAALLVRRDWAVAFQPVERCGWIGLAIVLLGVWAVRTVLEIADRLL